MSIFTFLQNNPSVRISNLNFGGCGGALGASCTYQKSLSISSVSSEKIVGGSNKKSLFGTQIYFCELSAL